MPHPLEKSKGFCPPPAKNFFGVARPPGNAGQSCLPLSRLTERNVLPAGQNPTVVGAGLCRGKTVL